MTKQVRGLFNSVPITIDEKGYLIQLMHVQEMRDVLTDIISEITSATQLESYECLKLIADI